MFKKLWKKSPFLFFNNKNHILNYYLLHKNTNEDYNPNLAYRHEIFSDLLKRYAFISNEEERLTNSHITSDLKNYIVPLLRRADRMSMMVGIESRVPYLDNDVLEFGLNLPFNYKIRRLNAKYLLKRVAERYLPKEIVYRQKKGFPLPINNWLDTENYKDTFYNTWLDYYGHYGD